MILKLIITGIFLTTTYFMQGIFDPWWALVLGLVLSFALFLLDEQYLSAFYNKSGKRNKRKSLITRSFLFIICLIPVTVFALTATDNVIGHGLTMGLNIQLLAELLAYRRKKAQFNKRFFWQFKIELSRKSINLFVLAALILFVFLTLIAIS